VSSTCPLRCSHEGINDDDDTNTWVSAQAPAEDVKDGYCGAIGNTPLIGGWVREGPSIPSIASSPALITATPRDPFLRRAEEPVAAHGLPHPGQGGAAEPLGLHKGPRCPVHGSGLGEVPRV
jgi:hypothetical protein